MLDVFVPDSPFVTEDNRRSRPILPTTAESLNRKHSALLPAHVVRGQSVLDLGCCIGATGHWVLKLGAARYTGVEHQDGYSEQAARLLSQWPNATIARQDAIDFLKREADRYGVVAMLGIAHGLFDPLALIESAAGRAATYLCFEDFGEAAPAPVLVAEPSMRMPLAGQPAGVRGFGWKISPQAMDRVMEFLGFAPDMKAEFIAADRWLCRYVRVGAPSQSAAYSREEVRWTP